MLRIALAVLTVLALLLAGRFAYMGRTTRPPDDLLATSGRLAPCPKSPNCVSSLAEDKSHRIAPLAVLGTADAALERVIQTIEAMPRARIVTSGKGYLHAEFTSRLFRFVDDLELIYDDSLPGFQVRSASRAGYSDMGANRKRVEALRAGLAAAVVVTAE